MLLDSPKPSEKSKREDKHEADGEARVKKVHKQKSADSIGTDMHGILEQQSRRYTSNFQQMALMSRTSSIQPPDEAHILSYEQVQELRIFPPPSQRTRVHFSAQTSANVAPLPRTLPAHEAWRYPANYVPPRS